MECVEFWQIDGGPSGTWWEAPEGLPEWGLATWDSTEEMLDGARQCKERGYEVRFHTLAEYELVSELDSEE